ncbi:hypothetical protein ACFL0O_12260, partial [Thermodesulfobacteriota bacterium]
KSMRRRQKPKAKAKAAPKAVPKAKKTPAIKAKKTAPAPKKKKVSVKDLINQKFETWKPEKVYSVDPDKAYLKNFVAPPFVSGTGEEQRRVKALLLKKFDTVAIKAAAETAAAAKVAEPEVSAPPVPPLDTDFDDPLDKTMKFFIVGLLVLICLVIGASALNSSNYYIETTNGSVEIWKGRFSPMGEKMLISLPGAELPEPIKDSYSRQEVAPVAFNYYVEKADALLDVPGLPDFEGIKAYLNKAMSYAVTRDLVLLANQRLKSIDLLILLYKAEVATSRGSLSDLEDARDYLSQAARLDPDDHQKDMINQKIGFIDESIETLKSKQAAKAIEAEVNEASAKAQ